MAVRLHVIRSKASSVYSRLCLDEALFRDKQKRCWVVVEDGSFVRNDVAVVLGLSGKVQELVHEEEARRDQVTLIRRFTGGGTVSVDRNAFLVTLVANASDIAPRGTLKGYPREILHWTDTQVFRPAFNQARVSGQVEFSALQNDYVVDGKYKVAGNAQGISNDRFCHHTSFLYRVNPQVMGYLKMPTKRPQYREDRSHEEFLKGLEGFIRSKEEFNNAIIDSFATAVGADEILFDAQPPPFLNETRNVIL